MSSLRLVVAKGTPSTIFTKLFKVYAVQMLTYEGERVEPYGRLRDQEVRAISDKAGVPVEEFFTHSLFD